MLKLGCCLTPQLKILATLLGTPHRRIQDFLGGGSRTSSSGCVLCTDCIAVKTQLLRIRSDTKTTLRNLKLPPVG